jgi:hypothetical protein
MARINTDSAAAPSQGSSVADAIAFPQTILDETKDLTDEWAGNRRGQSIAPA